MSKDDAHEIDVDKDGKDGDWNVVDSSSIPKEDEENKSAKSIHVRFYFFNL